jgi:hypothetical protein
MCKKFIFVVLFVLMMIGVSHASLTTVTLNENTLPSPFRSPWFESGVSISLFLWGRPETLDGREGIQLYPDGLLYLNFNNIPNVTSHPVNVAIDIINSASIGSTSAKLYKNGNLMDEVYNTSVGKLETLFLESNSGGNQLFIPGFNTFINEVRINVTPIPSSVFLLASGLLGLAGLKKRWR